MEKDEDGFVLCDVCLTWTATHLQRVGSEMYPVCDKSRCQDRVGGEDEEMCCRCGRPMIGSVVLTTKDIGEYETFSEILAEKAVCLDCFSPGGQ